MMIKSKRSRHSNWIYKARIIEALIVITILIIQQGLFRAIVISFLKLKALKVYFFFLKKFKICIRKH